MDGAKCQRIVVEPALLTQVIAGEMVPLYPFMDPVATPKSRGSISILPTERAEVELVRLMIMLLFGEIFLSIHLSIAILIISLIDSSTQTIETLGDAL